MSADGGLPGVDDEGDDDRLVLHVDLDCFYAACERLREPELIGEPVVVGMGFEPGDDGGAVATASYEAREHGIESAQAISTAMDRLPPRRQVDDDYDEATAHYRPVEMAYYQARAEEVNSILETHAETVRRVSIDEAYLDCTAHTGWEAAETYARSLKAEIREEVGLPVSIGVAPNMSVAKIASDHDKPDGLVVVPPGEVRSFLGPLPLEDLHGVGPVTAAELADRDLETIGEVAGEDRAALIEAHGERGRELHDRARGIDRRQVTPRGDPKSLSRESAFGEATEDYGRIADRITELAEAVAERATDRGATYRTIGIKVVTPPFEINTRERSLPGPVNDPDLVVEVAGDLLEEFRDASVRKVGVRVSNLNFAPGDQTRLGSWSTESEGGEWEGHRGTQVRLNEFAEDPG